MAFETAEIIYCEYCPWQTVEDPLIAPGWIGLFREMVMLIPGPVPQAFVPETVTAPVAVNALVYVTEIEEVPCPLVRVAPVGTDQL